MSLSARRAWIEIISFAPVRACADTSLSARRAWIEIAALAVVAAKVLVALSEESVDRNARARSGSHARS